MNNSSSPIGVLDSGIGGFSVVAKLKEQLPHEDIIYFGDNAHCPYGPRTKENVVELAQGMIDFLIEKKVKALVIACNTVSSLVENLSLRDVPHIETIDPVCRVFSMASPRKVGIIATALTTKSKAYENKLKEENPSLETLGVTAHNLAALIEQADFEKEEIDHEIRSAMVPVVENNIKYVIWGCTHYPLVAKRFTQLYPDITFFDPAVFQIRELSDILRENNMNNPRKDKGKFTLYTSGTASSAIKAIEKLNLPFPEVIYENQLL